MSEGRKIRRVYASAVITIGAEVTAKALARRSADVVATIDARQTANPLRVPPELRGIKLVFRGADAPRRVMQVERALRKLEDTSLDPDTRELIIAALLAFREDEPEKAGE